MLYMQIYGLFIKVLYCFLCSSILVIHNNAHVASPLFAATWCLLNVLIYLLYDVAVIHLFRQNRHQFSFMADPITRHLPMSFINISRCFDKEGIIEAYNYGQTTEIFDFRQYICLVKFFLDIE